LPQEITAEDSKEILHDIKSLNHEQLGQVMTIVSRLGSRPHRLLDSATPSPGELRKLLLAKGMTQSPYLIVMDEPTNHLDLPSIVALEAALAECPCALLLVSHDQTLLNRLCDTHWQLTQTDRSKTKLVTHYRPA
jgi:macrolide transport system ATP-binding/permease protein